MAQQNNNFWGKGLRSDNSLKSDSLEASLFTTPKEYVSEQTITWYAKDMQS